MAVTSIQVMVRLQPPPSSTVHRINANQLQLGKHHFKFDHVFDHSDSQLAVFDRVGASTVQNCLIGYNGCLFLYGQTGSGKTYTMSGSGRCNGLMQNSFQYLAERLDEIPEQAIIGCTFVEIYNEQIFDLLDPTPNKKLSLREDIRRGVFMEGVLEESVQSAAQLEAMMTRGLNNRHVGETMMNKESSRSHSIFTLNLLLRIENNGVKGVRTSKLHFVDLAGSERQQSTQAIGERLKQANNINRSLSVLGQVINSLSTKKCSHIRYRDSKLTFLLRDSLGGNSKTTVIATVSSAASSFHESLSTLKFAESAKLIKIKAQINQECVSSNVEALRTEVAHLRQQLFQSESIVKELKSVQGCSHFEDVEMLKQKTEEVIAMMLRTLQGQHQEANLDDMSKLKKRLESFLHPSQDNLLQTGTAEFDIEQIVQQNISLRNKVQILQSNVQLQHSKSVMKTRERGERVERLQANLRMLQGEYDTLEQTLEYEREQHKQASQRLTSLQHQRMSIHQQCANLQQSMSQLSNDNCSLSRALSESQQRIAILEREIDRSRQEMAKYRNLEEELDEYEETHKYLKQEISKILGSKKVLTKNLLTYKDKLKAVVDQCRAKDEQLMQANNEVYRLSSEYSTVLGQQDELRRFAQRMDGAELAYVEAQQALRQENRQLRQQNQIMARSLMAKQEEYGLATKNLKYRFQEKKTELSSYLAEFSTVQMRYQDRIAQLEQGLGEAGQQYSSLQAAMEQLRQENSRMREQLQASQASVDAFRREVEQLTTQLQFVQAQSTKIRNSLQSRKSESSINCRLSDFDRESLQEQLRDSEDRVENLTIKVIQVTDECKRLALIIDIHSKTINRLTYENRVQQKKHKWSLDFAKEENMRLLAQVGELEISRDTYREAALQGLSSERVKQHVQRQFHKLNVDLKQLRKVYSELREAYSEGLFQADIGDLMEEEQKNLDNEETVSKCQNFGKVALQLKQYERLTRELLGNFCWLFEQVRPVLKDAQLKEQLAAVLEGVCNQTPGSVLMPILKLNDLLSGWKLQQIELASESLAAPHTPLATRTERLFTS